MRMRYKAILYKSNIVCCLNIKAKIDVLVERTKVEAFGGDIYNIYSFLHKTFILCNVIYHELCQSIWYLLTSLTLISKFFQFLCFCDFIHFKIILSTFYFIFLFYFVISNFYFYLHFIIFKILKNLEIFHFYKNF